MGEEQAQDSLEKTGRYDRKHFSGQKSLVEGSADKKEEGGKQEDEQKKVRDEGKEKNTQSTGKGRDVKMRICKVQVVVFAGVLLCLAVAGIGRYCVVNVVEGENAVKETEEKIAEMEVPNLIYASVWEAQLQLEALGLKMQEEKEETEDMPEGIVLSQMPAAGSAAAALDIVFVTVSTGGMSITESVQDTQEKIREIQTEELEEISNTTQETQAKEQQNPSVSSQPKRTQQSEPQQSEPQQPQQSEPQQSEPQQPQQSEPQQPVEDNWSDVPEENVSDDWENAPEENIPDNWGAGEETILDDW